MLNDLTILDATSSTEKLVYDPLCSGFLFKFCKAHYCAENISFLLDIDRYRDYFSNEESAWENKSWKEIDTELGLTAQSSTLSIDIKGDLMDPLSAGHLISAETWPSQKIEPEVVEGMIKMIWGKFLSDAAPDQICLPSSVLANTVKRLTLIHKYGKEVFQEATVDPLKTIQRDIAPRFLSSPDYVKYVERLKELQEPPCSVTIQIPSLGNTVNLNYSKSVISKKNVNFALDEFLNDRTMYGEFLKYLNRSVASENLRFLRAIQHFKEQIKSNEVQLRSGAVDLAFKIHLNFIMDSAPYEICITEQCKRDIMRQLAEPVINTFDVAEKSAMDAIKIHYESYKSSKDFSALYDVILDKYDSMKSTRRTPRNSGTASSHNNNSNNNSTATTNIGGGIHSSKNSSNSSSGAGAPLGRTKSGIVFKGTVGTAGSTTTAEEHGGPRLKPVDPQQQLQRPMLINQQQQQQNPAFVHPSTATTAGCFFLHCSS